MCIIAVSDSGFRCGQEFAETLARKLSLRYLDATSLVERAATWGGDRLKLKTSCENAPGFFDRFSRNRLSQIMLLHAALAEEVRSGNAVCYGLASQLLTVNATPILRIRLENPLSVKQRKVQTRVRIFLGDAASYTQKSVRDKRRWARYLFGAADGIARHEADLTMHLEQKDFGEACEVIRNLIENQTRFVPTASDLALQEGFAVSTRIKAALAQDTRIAHQDLKVELQGNRVILSGYVWSAAEMASLAQIASLIPAGIKVDLRQVHVGAWDYPYFLPDFLPIEWLIPREDASPKPSRVPRRRPNWVLAGAASAVGLFILTLGGVRFWMARFTPAGSSMQNFSGLITDSECALAQNAALQTPDCARSCVKQRGAQYVLKTPSGSYVLADQQKGEKFAGERVSATGALDEESGELRLQSLRAVVPISN